MADVKDITLKNLKPKEKAYTHMIEKGLSLLIKPTGTKLWEFRYKSPSLSKRRKTSLGTYPDTTLASAKKKAQEYRTLIADEIDPIDFNKSKKAEEEAKVKGIFENVVNEWCQRQS